MTEAERIKKMQMIRYKFLAINMSGDAGVGIRLLKQWANLCGHVSVVNAVGNFERFINTGGES